MATVTSDVDIKLPGTTKAAETQKATDLRQEPVAAAPEAAKIEKEVAQKEAAPAANLKSMLPAMSPEVEAKVNQILAGNNKFYVSRAHPVDRELVRYLQKLMNAADPSLKLSEDGLFGPKTDAALKTLQAKFASDVSYQRGKATRTIDGVVGRRTMSVLMREAGVKQEEAPAPSPAEELEAAVAPAASIETAGKNIMTASYRAGTDEGLLCSALFSLSPAEVISLKERMATGEFSKGVIQPDTDPKSWKSLERIIRRETSRDLQDSLLDLVKLPADASKEQIAAARVKVCDALRKGADAGNIPWTQVAPAINTAGELGISDVVAASRYSLNEQKDGGYFMEALNGLSSYGEETISAFVAAYGEKELKRDINMGLKKEQRRQALDVLGLDV